MDRENIASRMEPIDLLLIEALEKKKFPHK